VSQDLAHIPAFQEKVDQQAKTIKQIREIKIAKVRNGKDLDSLIADSDPSVRCAVAKYGSDADRLKLANDPDDSVRIQVSKLANKNIAMLMVNDSNDTVQKYVRLALTQV